MTIKLFGCGGTIDKSFNELNGELVFNRQYLSEMLRQARSSCDVRSEYIMMKDSLDMVDEDRKVVLKACKDCLENRIIIAHGTDTMTKTAEVLGSNVDNKTIVLFGAMIPYSFKDSDALFNLGYALASVQLLGFGVYVTMNGNVFPWYNVRKNVVKGRFENAK